MLFQYTESRFQYYYLSLIVQRAVVRIDHDAERNISRILHDVRHQSGTSQPHHSGSADMSAWSGPGQASSSGFQSHPSGSADVSAWSGVERPGQASSSGYHSGSTELSGWSSIEGSGQASSSGFVEESDYSSIPPARGDMEYNTSPLPSQLITAPPGFGGPENLQRDPPAYDWYIDAGGEADTGGGEADTGNVSSSLMGGVVGSEATPTMGEGDKKLLDELQKARLTNEKYKHMLVNLVLWLMVFMMLVTLYHIKPSVFL